MSFDIKEMLLRNVENAFPPHEPIKAECDMGTWSENVLYIMIDGFEKAKYEFEREKARNHWSSHKTVMKKVSVLHLSCAICAGGAYHGLGTISVDDNSLVLHTRTRHNILNSKYGDDWHASISIGAPTQIIRDAVIERAKVALVAYADSHNRMRRTRFVEDEANNRRLRSSESSV